MHIDYTAEQTAMKPRLEAANINPTSFLATDYLNHFNEIVMLLEMVPDMPEMIEETYEWAPKPYSQHFLDSGFQAKELAVEAYEKAPAPIRSTFESVCGKLDGLVTGTIESLKKVNAAERGLSEPARLFIGKRIEEIQGLLMKLNQVIHGHLDEQLADMVPDTPDSVATDDESAHTQAEIDALFDE
ncbi:hypothetical protein BXY39_1500 [Eilatimonas milleporae]|uniref:Uncharacterized protein n=2 Tax=Eilatimonas milleporae TaxID=911205 RepID=A0A3M0CGV3_9PROT|nr:hypothetical protein BXY39_1500 [Eilatimonas milleporae]